MYINLVCAQIITCKRLPAISDLLFNLASSYTVSSFAYSVPLVFRSSIGLDSCLLADWVLIGNCVS